MTGLELIVAEYTHQFVEGSNGSVQVEESQLAMAAACYAAPEQLYRLQGGDDDFIMADPWPWEKNHDRRQSVGERKLYGGTLPADPDSCTIEERIELLALAGAMIAAEIDRLKTVSMSGAALTEIAA